MITTPNVPTKTPLGLDELRKRSLGLSQRHRTVLLLVDGRRPLSEVLSLAQQAGAATTHFEELVRLGLVELPSDAAAPEPQLTEPGALDGPRLTDVEVAVPMGGALHLPPNLPTHQQPAPQPNPEPSSERVQERRPERPPMRLEPLPAPGSSASAAQAAPPPPPMRLEPEAVAEPLPAPVVERLMDAVAGHTAEPVQAAAASPVDPPTPTAARAPDALRKPAAPPPPRDELAMRPVIGPPAPVLPKLAGGRAASRSGKPTAPVQSQPQPQPQVQQPQAQRPQARVRATAPAPASSSVPTPRPSSAQPGRRDAVLLRPAAAELVVPPRPAAPLPIDPSATAEPPANPLMQQVRELLMDTLRHDPPPFGSRLLGRLGNAQTLTELGDVAWEIERYLSHARRSRGGMLRLQKARELLGLGNTLVDEDSRSQPDEDDEDVGTGKPR